MIYAIVGYVFAGVLWIVWVLSVRARLAGLRRSRPELLR
jgi:hypothetical protein